MMRRLLLVAPIAILAAGACTSSGGAATGGSELRTNNATGTVMTTLGQGLESAHQSAIQAMQDLRYTVNEQPLDANKGLVKATTADGTKVEATLTRDGDRQTKLSVNAGITHSDIARNVARKIQERTH